MIGKPLHTLLNILGHAVPDFFPLGASFLFPFVHMIGHRIAMALGVISTIIALQLQASAPQE
jgi:hypothetical protein